VAKRETRRTREQEATEQEALDAARPLNELEVIYRTAPVGLCVLDQALRYVRINDWLADLNGQPAKAHIGRTVREMLPRLAPQLEPHYRRVLETGEAVLDVEVKGETARYPGVQRVFRDQYHPLHDAAGNVVGVNVVVEEVTALKEEEEMRRASEARFRALANSMPQLVWTAEPDGTVDYYNDRYREFSGISRGSEGHWEWGPVVHPEDLPRTAAAWQQALSTGTMYEVEHRVQRSDGTYCWYLSRGVPVRDQAGRIVKWYGTATDVNDLRLAEQALRAGEEKFRTIFELSAVGQAETEPATGRFIAANRRMVDITGYSQEELLGMTFGEIVHPEEREDNRTAYLNAMAEQQREFVAAARCLRKDGTIRWVEIRSGLIYDEQGDAQRSIATVADVTERIEAEAERERLIAALAQERASLRELNETLEKRVRQRTESLAQAHREMQRARDLFYTLFHSSPIPIVLTRPDSGEVLDANRAYLSFFGFTREELVGRTTIEMGIFKNPEDRARVIERMMATGHADEMELIVRTRGGEERTALVSSNLVELDGEPLALAAFLDVTPLVRAQGQIRHLASELSLAEERVRRRIAQVLHDDIQQMLVAVQIMLQMHAWDASAADQETLQKADEYLRETLEATRQLSSELSSPTLRSPAVLDGLLALAAFMEERYSLKVWVEVDEAGDIGDDDVRGVIMRLVRELLFNVVKHAGVREAWVTARREGDELRIEVADQGRGFDPEAIDGVEAGPGFGLGSMEERLALFGGWLEVEAAEGEGTRVRVVVPMEQG
jgi:PAS domain S-box-containing protein